MSRRIGPFLPPHLLTAADSNEGDVDDGVLLLHDSNDGILSADSSVDSDSDGSDSTRRSSHKTSFTTSKQPILKTKRSEKSQSDDEIDAYGPALPPHLKSKTSFPSPKAANAKTKKHSEESESDGKVNTFGPALPPHLKSKTSIPSPKPANPKTRKHLEENESDGEVNSFGPALPPQLKSKTSIPSPKSFTVKTREHLEESESEGEIDTYGPALPPHLKSKTSIPSPKAAYAKTRKHLEESESDGEIDTYGPALPPNLKSRPSPLSTKGDKGLLERSANSESDDGGSDPYGPALPPHYQPKPAASSSSSTNTRPSIIGPALPPGILLNAEEDSDDEMVGPMPLPEGFESNPAYIQEELEKRAERMKRRLRGEEESDSGVVKRENWMLELPPDRASEFGLGPRQFRARAKLDPGDRSVWTDTPEDALRKQAMPEPNDDSSTVDEMQRQVIAERDRAMQKYTDKHNKKKRKESLVDMHQKKLKKKQKKEAEKLKDKKTERRPFDRDVDLQANRFDEAQKQAVLRKAQLLDDRFSRGASKFL